MRGLTFVVGTGRCGSTALHHYLARHPRVSWLSNVMSVLPARTGLNRMVLELDRRVPVQGLTRGRIRPSESYPFWEHHVPGFSEPYRDLRRGDATARHARRLRSVLPALVADSRPHLLVKLTGWPRVGFLSEIFPQARFVHLIRDGRAVANSLLHVDFWSGWLGPENWRWGRLSSDQHERWQEAGQSFVALAGLEWELLVSAHRRALKQLPVEKVLEVRYEELTSEPRRTVQRILAHGDLSAQLYSASAPETVFRPSDERWTRDLTPNQQDILEGCIEGSLIEFGYTPRR